MFFCLQGLQYISNSDLKLHGKLKSSNVLIDGRWVVRLTDYGCCLMTSSQIADEEESDHAKFSSKSHYSSSIITENMNM